MQSVRLHLSRTMVNSKSFRKIQKSLPRLLGDRSNALWCHNAGGHSWGCKVVTLGQTISFQHRLCLVHFPSTREVTSLNPLCLTCSHVVWSEFDLHKLRIFEENAQRGKIWLDSRVKYRMTVFNHRVLMLDRKCQNMVLKGKSRSGAGMGPLSEYIHANNKTPQKPSSRVPQ